MKVSIFVNDNYVKSDKTSMLYLRVFLNRRYVIVPLDVSVNPEYFDKKFQKVTRGANKIKLNHIITDALGRASNIILKYQFNRQNLTKDIFIKEFKNPAVFVDFYAFMYDQIMNRVDVTESTRRQHLTILNKMKAFRNDLLLVELDQQFLQDFQTYLKKRLKNSSNTVFNALKTVRTYVNIAVKQELITKSPFAYFKLKREKTYPEFLSENELKILFELYRSNRLINSHRKVLRWFLFACQTGLRIGDLRSVRHEDIRNNILSFRPKKTQNINNKRLDLPLSKFALKLINDEAPLRVRGLLFDCYSEQRMNSYIKEVMKVAGIDKNVSFHTARHTFATLFLKKSKRANGILILQKLLGHSSIQSTMIYSHVLDDDLRLAIDEFSTILE